MWSLMLKIFESLAILSLDLTSVALPVIDAGIQVWNSISINNEVFVKNEEWGEVTPAHEFMPRQKIGKLEKRDTECLSRNCSSRYINQALNGDFSKVKNKLLEIYISESLNFEVSYETVISVAIIQFPAVCLAFFGIFKAFTKHGVSCPAFTDSLKAICLIFVPFCLVELFGVIAFQSMLLQIFLEKVKMILDAIFGDCTTSFMQNFDLLFFLPNKDSTGRDKLLALEMTKLIFGTCIQLCFQMVLLLGYTKTEEVEYSQIFSIVLSFLVICRSGVSIARFKRKQQQDNSYNNEENVSQKLKAYLQEEAEKITKEKTKEILCCTLILLLSITANIGTLILTVLVFNWFGSIYIVFVFLCNLIVSVILPFSMLERLEQKLKIEFKLHKETDNESFKRKVTRPLGPRVARGILTSLSNIFFISRPVEETSYHRVKLMVLLQILRFPINFLTGLTVLTYTLGYSSYSPTLKSKLSSCCAIFLLAGVLKLILVFMKAYNRYKESEFYAVTPEKEPLNSIKEESINLNGIEEENTRK